MSKYPIRILQIVPNMQSGGLENFIMNIYKNIDRNLVQFDFLVHYNEEKFFDKEILAMGGKIYRFSLRNDNNLIKYIVQLNKFYKNHKEYRVIHCHMSSIGFINFLIAKKNKVSIRIAHSHNSATDKTLKGRVKRFMMLPYKYVSTINYACSPEAGKYLYGNRSFEFIPNAVDTDKFRFLIDDRNEIRRKYGIDKDTVVIGHIGRFNVQKNHDFLIDMFKKYNSINPNSKLILIGNGELYDNVKKKVEENNLKENVIFTGVIKETWKYYSAFDIFVLPSLFEGLPVVGVEAQCSGVKCLFADNITKEVKVTDLIDYLKLELDTWVNAICNMDLNYFRNDYYKIVKNTNFNIKTLAKRMQEKYIKLYGGNNNED